MLTAARNLQESLPEDYAVEMRLTWVHVSGSECSCLSYPVRAIRVPRAERISASPPKLTVGMATLFIQIPSFSGKNGNNEGSSHLSGWRPRSS